MNRVESLQRLRQELALRGDLVSTGDTTPKKSTSAEQATASTTLDASATPTRSLLLTVPEACSELRISRAQFYILANKHKAIETVHIGKLCRVRRQALEQYVDGLRSGVQL
jgi:excisionase family DNA binding protein